MKTSRLILERGEVFLAGLRAFPTPARDLPRLGSPCEVLPGVRAALPVCAMVLPCCFAAARGCVWLLS